MELIKKLISNKTVKYGILIGIFALIIYIALSVGLNKFKKQQKLENEVYKPREVFFTLYHVDWCPYCQTTKPVYEDVSGTFGNTVTTDGAKIIFRDFNCTEETVNKIVNGKEITSFPTIYFDDGVNPQVEFKSKCEKRAFTQFVKDMTD